MAYGARWLCITSPRRAASRYLGSKFKLSVNHYYVFILQLFWQVIIRLSWVACSVQAVQATFSCCAGFGWSRWKPASYICRMWGICQPPELVFTEWRQRLSNRTFHELLKIELEGPSTAQFDPQETHTSVVAKISIMMLMKFSDLSQSDRINWVMWQVKDPCPRPGSDGCLTREKWLS